MSQMDDQTRRLNTEGENTVDGDTSPQAADAVQAVRVRSSNLGPEKEEVAADANALSNQPYSEGNWISTQQFAAIPAVGVVSTLMPSPVLEASHPMVVTEERTVTEGGEKVAVYRESTLGGDGVSSSVQAASLQTTGYVASAQTYAATQTHTYGSSSAHTYGYSSLGPAYVSSAGQTALYGGGGASGTQTMTTTRGHQMGTAEVIVPAMGAVVSLAPGQTTGQWTTESYGDMSARPATTETRQMSGVGENERHTTDYVQSFAGMRDAAFLSSGWNDSRVASRLSSTVLSAPLTYPPHPDQTVICWPPRVPLQTQGQSISNTDVERWRTNTAYAQGVDNVQFIEVEVVEERTVHKPVKQIQERIVHKKKPVVEYIDKIVYDKTTEWIEKPKYVEQVVWVEKKVPKIQIVEKQVEFIKKVPKHLYRTKEVVKEVPFVVERPVPQPIPYHLKTLNVHDAEKATVVAQILKAQLRETDEVAEVPLKEFVPELVPVVIQIPKAVSVQVWLGGIVSTVHRQTTVTAAHWNSLVRLANSNITNMELLPYMREVSSGFIPFLPSSERVEWVEPLSQEWRLTGWSHVIVPDNYSIKSLEILVAEFNQARAAEYREAKQTLTSTVYTATSTSEIVTPVLPMGQMTTQSSVLADLHTQHTQSTLADLHTQHTARTSGLLAGAVTGTSLSVNPPLQGTPLMTSSNAPNTHITQTTHTTHTTQAFNGQRINASGYPPSRTLKDLAPRGAGMNILLSELNPNGGGEQTDLPGTFVNPSM
eukprot:Gregarina_sp_Pseudo_9__3225@NODE_340_length_3107_cov_31_797588_g320_i0_p1_GENE_NODE_340_length_3107_cov_31_797588_g320_i0NODE_340_length_3107_cov_31_797588_g320_i0_p1_ORF_typecomplete_len765_score208_21ATPgrasp_TupA/PF14305_6/0_16_NODE_340_length_3107_cov_31_797588_g320_i07193013